MRVILDGMSKKRRNSESTAKTSSSVIYSKFWCKQTGLRSKRTHPRLVLRRSEAVAPHHGRGSKMGAAERGRRITAINDCLIRTR